MHPVSTKQIMAVAGFLEKGIYRFIYAVVNESKVMLKSILKHWKHHKFLKLIIQSLILKCLCNYKYYGNFEIQPKSH